MISAAKQLCEGHSPGDVASRTKSVADVIVPSRRDWRLPGNAEANSDSKRENTTSRISVAGGELFVGETRTQTSLFAKLSSENPSSIYSDRYLSQTGYVTNQTLLTMNLVTDSSHTI